MQSEGCARSGLIDEELVRLARVGRSKWEASSKIAADPEDRIDGAAGLDSMNRLG
jgi:hypothetical protein